jgi:CRISPR-associated protein Csb1
MSHELIEQYDAWLKVDGPAALVIREHLVPVEGPDGVVFPATFAAGDGFEGGYNIDRFPDGSNVCLIDTVGSQANRIEPLFATECYAGLVPQIVIKAGDKRVNLLEAGHRAGDAIVRCSALQEELRAAFQAVQHGDCGPLAKIAPTSIVFGAWDSRDTQAKLPRLVASTIRAFNVRELTRSAQYCPPVDYAALEVFSEEDRAKAEGDKKNPLAKRGFVHVPATGTHGGVIATGGIRREATFHLAALRMLSAAGGPETADALRRYILGLALTALTHVPAGYLRQGCHVVLDPDKPREFKMVYADGHREDVTVTHQEALAFAQAAATMFGLDPGRMIDFQTAPDREVEFETERAKKDVSGDTDAGGKRARKASAKQQK